MRVLTLDGEVELHKQPCLSVAVSCADPNDDRVTVADVNGPRCGYSSGTRTFRTQFSNATIVNGNCDGQTIIKTRDWDLGSIFSAKLHGCHLGRDGVVGNIVEGERVGLHLDRNS